MALTSLCSSLVRKLLAQGIEHTTKSLKSLASAADAGVLRDDAAELWICLIQLAISDEPRTALLDERRFWTLVMDTVIDKVPAAARHSPIAGEACAYTAMTLCALSQFAPSGLCGATPRLKAHWPVMLRALEAIDLGELRQSELEGLSDTALARRDRYLHTLFARTIVLAQRWGWRITVNDAIVPKLFAVLNARELADLSIEMRDDFPPFLRTFNGQIADLAFNPSADTVFDVYCKLLFTAVEGVTDSRALTRFLLRVCPSQVNSWTRQTGRGASTLVNHLSLFAISVFLLPSSARQRIAQATQLVPFEKASDTAKRIQLRSAMYFLLMLKWHGVDSQPVIQWLVSVSNRLKATYCQALADRKSKKEGAKPYGAAGDLLKPSARLLALLLDSVRFVATWQRPEQSRPAAPDLHLLHDAWISSLLDSPLATDPLVAVQVASFVESFLQTRDAALAPSRAPTNSESQDEFGVFDDFDYADPALNAMLGVEPDAALSEGKALADVGPVCCSPYKHCAQVSPTDPQAPSRACDLSRAHCVLWTRRRCRAGYRRPSRLCRALGALLGACAAGCSGAQSLGESPRPQLRGSPLTSVYRTGRLSCDTARRAGSASAILSADARLACAFSSISSSAIRGRTGATRTSTLTCGARLSSHPRQRSSTNTSVYCCR